MSGPQRFSLLRRPGGGLLLLLALFFPSKSAWAGDLSVADCIRILESSSSSDAAMKSALRMLLAAGPAAKPAVPALIGVLRSGDDLDCIYAFATLSHLGAGAGAALPALDEVANQSASKGVRILAAHAARQIRAAGGKPPPQQGPPPKASPPPAGKGGTAMRRPSVHYLSEPTGGKGFLLYAAGMKASSAAALAEQAAAGLVSFFDAPSHLVARARTDNDDRAFGLFRAHKGGKEVEGVLEAGLDAGHGWIFVAAGRPGRLAETFPSLFRRARGIPVHSTWMSGDDFFSDQILCSSPAGNTAYCDVVLRFGPPADVLKPALAQWARRPDARATGKQTVEKIFSAHALPASSPGARAAILHVLFRSAGRGSGELESICYAESVPMHGAGQWALELTVMGAPPGDFERTLPTLLRHKKGEEQALAAMARNDITLRKALAIPAGPGFAAAEGWDAVLKADLFPAKSTPEWAPDAVAAKMVAILNQATGEKNWRKQ